MQAWTEVHACNAAGRVREFGVHCNFSAPGSHSIKPLGSWTAGQGAWPLASCSGLRHFLGSGRLLPSCRPPGAVLHAPQASRSGWMPLPPWAGDGLRPAWRASSGPTRCSRQGAGCRSCWTWQGRGTCWGRWVCGRGGGGLN